jgi:hydrogenase maturation protease
MSRILVAGVGNVLRGDDGFGPAVIERLGELPAGAEAVETGIGGVALLQELLAGCGGLVLVDAVDRGAAAGTLFELRPEVGEAVHAADVHLANPDRVLSMARTMGALPARVRIVGCQPGEVDELGGRLSPAVAAAVEPAVATVRRIVGTWLEEPAHAGL